MRSAVLLCRDVGSLVPFYSRVLGWSFVNGLIRATSGEDIGRIVPTDAVTRGWLPVLSGSDPRFIIGAETTEVPHVGSLWRASEGEEWVFEHDDRRWRQPASEYRAADPRPGHLSWAQLNTPSFEVAADRYSSLAGWTMAPSDNDKFTYRRFLLKGRTHAGAMLIDQRSGLQIQPQWQLYFRLDDVELGAERIVAEGGTVVVEPTTIAGGQFAVGRDPEGHLFAVDRMSHLGRTGD